LGPNSQDHLGLTKLSPSHPFRFEGRHGL
jgi:hypothetical protein